MDTALREDDGTLRGFSRVVRDITEQEAMEEELRASRQLLRALAAKLEAIREAESSSIVCVNL